jgi:hypothetical protein
MRWQSTDIFTGQMHDFPQLLPGFFLPGLVRLVFCSGEHSPSPKGGRVLCGRAMPLPCPVQCALISFFFCYVGVSQLAAMQQQG